MKKRKEGTAITTEKTYIDKLINENMAFIISTVSRFTGRYVETEKDDEFSIALSAFGEACSRYDETRGPLLPFAKTVMESRLKNYAEKEKRGPAVISLEQMQDEGFEPAAEEYSDENPGSLKEEIADFADELMIFGLTLEKLADEAPKHKDTRKNALTAAEKSSKDNVTVEEMYRKKKLPVKRVAFISSFSEKVIKRSRSFILASIIVFIKKFPSLVYWIKGTR